MFAAMRCCDISEAELAQQVLGEPDPEADPETPEATLKRTTILQQLSESVRALLAQAMRHGDVCIVTNGTRSWVYESARKFYPGLLPTLEQVDVVSAREAYELKCPGGPMEWKRRAFRDVVLHWQWNLADNTKLVVLGDSRAEIEAAWALEDLLCVKTIKFKEKPTIRDLIGQLGKVGQEFDGIVHGNESVKIHLAQEDLILVRDSTTPSWEPVWSINKVFAYPQTAGKSQQDWRQAGKARLQELALSLALAVPLPLLPGGKRARKNSYEGENSCEVSFDHVGTDAFMRDKCGGLSPGKDTAFDELYKYY
jgi:hypothetical protein